MPETVKDSGLRTQSRWRWLSMVLAMVCAAHVAGGAAVALCGNGTVEASEQCDDGGICIGGTNAGQACTAEEQCLGNGVCVGGAKDFTGCVADADCPNGACVHCKPFGGDGCAANCTLES